MQDVIDADWEPSTELVYRKQRAYDYISRNEDKLNRKIAKLFLGSLAFFLWACLLSFLMGAA